jgi:hypothetical protein
MLLREVYYLAFMYLCYDILYKTLLNFNFHTLLCYTLKNAFKRLSTNLDFSSSLCGEILLYFIVLSFDMSRSCDLTNSFGAINKHQCILSI